MAARSARDTKRNRTDEERVRLYSARTLWHQKQQSRRVRDTAIAVVVGGIIVVGAVVSQTMHAHVNAPVPEPTQSTSE